MVNSPQFKIWFGNSKVVDKEGNPLLVYRGESEEFTVYKTRRLGSHLGGPFSKAGFFFSPNENTAHAYANTRAYFGSEPIVKKCYLRIENPYTLDHETWHRIMNWGSLEGQISKSQAFKAAKELIQKIKIERYDGIFLLDRKGEIGEYVVFSSKQIKSENNIGTFDPNNPDISKEGVINEGSELPPELSKEAEGVTKAAIGWLYSPFLRSAFLKLDNREKEHDAGINDFKKFVRKVKKFHETAPHGAEKDLELVVYDLFSWENLKKNKHRLQIHLKKDEQGTTTVTSQPRYNEVEGVFFEYGDWADPQKDNPAVHYQRFLKQYEDSWAQSKQYKDDYIYGFISGFTTCEQYKNFREPTMLIKNPLSPNSAKLSMLNGYPYVIEMDVNFNGKKIPFFFNVVKTAKDVKVKHPNHESNDGENVYVYMTLITDYIVDFRGLDNHAVERALQTANHEAIHVFQDIRKSGISTGLPKQQLQYKQNPYVRGINIGGTATSDSIHKEPHDDGNRVTHAFRTVEFKTNLFNMISDFKRMLGQNLPQSRWEEGFKWLIEEITGRNTDWNWRQDFYKIFPSRFSWEVSTARRNLEMLFQSDRPKFKQYVKELYKGIFISPEAAKEWEETKRGIEYQNVIKRWMQKLGKL